MTGVTQRNTCHVSGGYGEDYEAAVLRFDTARLEWAEVGKMEDIRDNCV